jgi:hypothetical protein
MLLKLSESNRLVASLHVNEQLLAVKLQLKEACLKNQTFENEIGELEMKLARGETASKEMESRLCEAVEKCDKLTGASDLTSKDYDKLKTNEARLSKESIQLKLDLSELNEKLQRQKQDYETQLSEARSGSDETILNLNDRLQSALSEALKGEETCQRLTNELAEARASEAELKASLELKDKDIGVLQNSLLKASGSDAADTSIAMKIAEMYAQLDKSETQMSELKRLSEEKANECAQLEESVREKERLVAEAESRRSELERSVRENEMQIKLLNELREKDTKQHIRSLSEMDSQLKKKSSEAEKIAHFMEQLRVKQERIQELESQYAKIERQSNQERQTFEKQAHENWLSARKLERELKDVKLELANAKERWSDLESTNKSVLMENASLKQHLYKLQGGAYYNNNNAVHAAFSSKKMLNSSSTSSPSSPKPAAASNGLSDESGSLLNNTENSSPVLNDSKTDPLQIDINQASNNNNDSRPPSTGGSSHHSYGSGAMVPPPQMAYPPIRPPLVPFRYPFPLPPMNVFMPASTSPNPQMYSPHQHQMMYKMMMQQQQQHSQSRSANSSQQPSPGSSKSNSIADTSSQIPYSATFPNGNSTSLINGI